MGKTRVYFSSVISDLTGALFGYSIGFVGGLLVLPAFLHHFRLDEQPPAELARSQSLIVSSWIVGAAFGVPFGIPVCSHYGRKACFIFSAVSYVIGTGFQVTNTGTSLGLFEIGRLLNGFGVGSGTLVSPLYISEISTPDDRGMLMSSYQVVIQASAVVGFWGAYAANAAIPNTSDLQWQIPVAVQFIPGAILLLGTLLIKETPHYLAAFHGLAEVEKSLSWFRDLPATDPVLKHEARALFTIVRAGARRQAIRKPSFLHEICSKRIRKRLVVGVGLFIAQNLSGMNALNYYVPVIFQTAGFRSVSVSLFLTRIFGAVKLATAALFMLVCVRVWGNRFWLISGTAVAGSCMFVLGSCIQNMPNPGADDPSSTSQLSARAILVILSVYLYCVALGVSSGPIAWNICAEIFPAHLNAKCCAVTACTQWVFQILVAAITPILLNSIGAMTFVFFGVCNALALVFYWACVPETRGVPLGEDMAAVFGVTDEDEDVFEAAEEIEEVAAAVPGDEVTPLLVAQRAGTRRRSSIALVV